MAKSPDKLLPPKPASPRVLIVSPVSLLNYVRGVWKFARFNPSWTIMTIPLGEQMLIEPESVLEWADAMVVAFPSQELAERARKGSIPAVCLVYSEESYGMSTVCVDNRAVGKIAFEHFRSLGLRHFGYLPWRGGADNGVRQAGFFEAAIAAGFADTTKVVECVLSSKDWVRDIEAQAAIFRSLPKPMGLFCFADWLAQPSLIAARTAGISVPEELAILGVDDDEIVCESSNPTLSSININHEKIGYEGAKLATEIAEGRTPPTEPTLVAPIGVIERQSTQVMAVPDDDVVAALRYIKAHWESEDSALNPQGIADAICVSRRGLDEKFKRHLGHTVSDELAARRLREALALVEQTDLNLVEIVARTGYKTVSHLTHVIRKQTGRPPMAHRKWVRP